MNNVWKLELPDSIDTIIFFCEGGIGKNIASTAVIRAIKKQFPTKKIVVVGGSPEVFIHNPHVKKLFNFGNALHFYSDLIADNPSAYIMKVEPYMHYDYLNKNKHVVECWCEMLGIEPDGVEPDLFFSPNELEAAKLYVDEFTNNGKKKFAIIQWVGGKTPGQPNNPKEMKGLLAEMYRRATPQKQMQEVVDFLVKECNCKVGVVQHPNFPKLEGTEVIFFPLRASISLIYYSDYFIGVDSFLQHAASAKQIQKKGLVIWGGTAKTCLGYDMQDNWEIKACPSPACHRPNSYLLDMQINGQMWDCPYGEPCMKRNITEVKDRLLKLYPNMIEASVQEDIKEPKETCKCPSTK